MNSKVFIWIGMTVGGTVGGFLPLLWGDNGMSIASVIFSFVGGILGIYFGYKLSKY